MAINFPASPSTNDTHTENAITWIFNGTSWNAQGDQVTAASIGLGNVDNTADADKPISTATQAALDAKADATYNVKNYGATGDGVTDDRGAIDAAIVAANGNGGGTVYLPDGEYRVSKNTASPKQAISLLDNVAIVGQSREGVVIKLLDSVAGDTPVMAADTGGTAENISICDITIDGNKSRLVTQPTASEDEGINIKNGENILIHNVRVKDCAMDPIDFDGGAKVMCSNLFIDNNGGSFHAAGAGTVYLTLTNSQFYNNGGNRINSGNPTVANSAGNIDLYLTNYATITNCISVGGPRPLSVNGAVRTHIANSIFIGSTGYPAVDLRGSGQTPSGEANFTNCRIIGASSSASQGVEINDEFAESVFTGCMFKGYTGIDVVDGGDLIVSGSIFGGNNHGVYLRENNNKRVLIEHSIFRDSHFGNAIRVECDAKGVAASNVFEKSSSSYVGIFLNTGSTTWNIENNKCDTTLKVVRAWAGSHTLRNNDFGSGTVEVRGDDHLFENNKLKNLFIDFTGSTDSRFTGNSIVGVFTGSAYPYEQIWINNYGSGAHAESGSAVLVAGTVTVNSAIIPSGAKISLTRQSASGTVGHLSIGTIAAGASFEINSSEPADTSTVFWRIEY